MSDLLPLLDQLKTSGPQRHYGVVLATNQNNVTWIILKTIFTIAFTPKHTIISCHANAQPPDEDSSVSMNSIHAMKNHAELELATTIHQPRLASPVATAHLELFQLVMVVPASLRCALNQTHVPKVNVTSLPKTIPTNVNVMLVTKSAVLTTWSARTLMNVLWEPTIVSNMEPVTNVPTPQDHLYVAVRTVTPRTTPKISPCVKNVRNLFKLKSFLFKFKTNSIANNQVVAKIVVASVMVGNKVVKWNDKLLDKGSVEYQETSGSLAENLLRWHVNELRKPIKSVDIRKLSESTARASTDINADYSISADDSINADEIVKAQQDFLNNGGSIAGVETSDDTVSSLSVTGDQCTTSDKCDAYSTTCNWDGSNIRCICKDGFKEIAGVDNTCVDDCENLCHDQYGPKSRCDRFSNSYQCNCIEGYMIDEGKCTSKLEIFFRFNRIELI